MQALYEEPNAVLRTRLIAAVLDACRDGIGRDVKEVISDKYGRSQYAIAEDCRLDPTGFARALNHKFYLPLDSCEKFCYKYLNKSIHEVLFGAAKATPLPRHLNFLGQQLYKLSVSNRDGKNELHSLYMLCKEIFDKDDRAIQYSLDAPVIEGNALAICRERLFEIADGVFCIPEEGAGRVLSPNVRTWIRRIQHCAKESCTTFAVMHLAIEFQTTLDYLLVRNYAQIGDISCRNEDGKEIIIRDRYAKDIFGMILLMSENARTDFIGQAWHRLFQITGRMSLL